MSPSRKTTTSPPDARQPVFLAALRFPGPSEATARTVHSLGLRRPGKRGASLWSSTSTTSSPRNNCGPRASRIQESWRGLLRQGMTTESRRLAIGSAPPIEKAAEFLGHGPRQVPE